MYLKEDPFYANSKNTSPVFYFILNWWFKLFFVLT